MKNLSILGIVLTLAAACGQKAPDTAKSATPAVNADSAGVATALHGFFTWYRDAEISLANKMDFVDASGDHPRLDEAKLAAYLAEFKKSGFVSDEFIADETKFYRACAKLWANEHPDDVPSGMDASRYYCAQETLGDYTTAPVKVTLNGDRAKARLEVLKEDNFILDFDLKKENGRWLLAKVGCDMGVPY